MEIQQILSFLGMAALLTLLPGPDIIFVLTESLTKGKNNGIAIATGLAAGVLVHTLAAATGLSVILYQSALAFQIVKYAGASYLMYLAVMSFLEKPNPTLSMVENLDNGKMIDKENMFKLVRKSFLMNVLNPKVSIFFIAFLPQFIIKSEMESVFQMGILGIIFMIQAFFIFCLVAILAGRFSVYLNSRRFWLVSKWLKVITFAILSIRLAFSEK